MADGSFNVFQIFSFVSPHQKHAALNATLPAHGNCLLYLFDLDSAIHGVEDSLRSAFRSNPDSKATQLGKQIKHLGVQAIRTRDALERDAEAPRAHLRGIL